MKNGLARALAIIALVFMVIFIAALIATVIDKTLLNGSVGYIALGCGVFVMMIFLALRADGRGFSITKMNNEIEMKKIEEELKKQQEREQAEKAEKERAANAENADGQTPESVQTADACAEKTAADDAVVAEKTETKPRKNSGTKKK